MRIRQMTIPRRFVALGVLIVGLMVLPVVPASAHATLVQSTPGDGLVVPAGPKQVELHYDQPVGTSAGSVKVLAPEGTRVDTGRITQSDGGTTVIDQLPAELPAGTYTILWRVLSADTHTVFGASTFSVKTASATTGAAAAAAADQATAGRAAADLLGVSRFVFYLGLLVLLGAMAFLALLWFSGREVRGARRLLWIAWGATTVGTVAGLLLQGPYSEGLSLYWTFDPELIAQVLPTRFGVSSLARLVLLAAIAGLLLGLRRWPRPVLIGGTVVLGLGLLVTTSSVGHAGTGDLSAFAFPSDVLHLAAAAAWIGGLAVLAVVLLRRPPAGLTSVLPRWSRYAQFAVLVLVITGTFAGWRQVREWGALTGTAYGVLLLVKVGLVAVMLGLAALGRARVRRHYALPAAASAIVTAGPGSAVSSAETAADPDGPFGGGSGGVGTMVPVSTAVRPVRHGSDPTVARRLRRSVLVEAGIAVVVLGVTSILVSTTPADESYFPVVDQTVSVTAGVNVHVVVTPARAGLDDLYLSYTDGSGKPIDVVAASGRFTLPGQDNVVPVQLVRTSLSHYDLSRVELSSTGTWTLAINTQTSDIDSTTALLTIRIR